MHVTLHWISSLPLVQEGHCLLWFGQDFMQKLTFLVAEGSSQIPPSPQCLCAKQDNWAIIRNVMFMQQLTQRVCVVYCIYRHPHHTRFTHRSVTYCRRVLSRYHSKKPKFALYTLVFAGDCFFSLPQGGRLHIGCFPEVLVGRRESTSRGQTLSHPLPSVLLGFYFIFFIFF